MTVPSHSNGSSSSFEAAKSQGRFDGQWFVEEFQGASRFGLRTKRKLHEEQTPFQKISVYDTSLCGRLLTLDDLVMCTERDEFVYHEMLAHVSLCTHPDPKKVLIIGGGDCGVAREALKHQSVQSVVQCEIDRRVTEVCREYFPWVSAVENDPRMTFVFEDGVSYIEEHPGSFDVLVIDSTDPIGPAAALFQSPFYERAASALKPGGIMVAQTESPHWNGPMLGPIYQNIRAVFEHVDAFWGAIPTYPSGSWLWAWASRSPRPAVDLDRAAAVSEGCHYYNPRLHEASFALPTFALKALQGENVFREFDEGLERP